MSLFVEGRNQLYFPTHAQNVFDVTGAGDTVVATTGAVLGAGMPMYEAVPI
ncbi:hypothetical protein [Chlorobaculum sp. 24CR]|jgi:bifunctional ADP-heptose synthase (sugar kinase/adenylyltransferase)|uniref:hypothetical protein n=1 Tax=Chlorobaculum sp. 24CR TaxID=2508878 RepID=UPI001ADCDA64